MQDVFFVKDFRIEFYTFETDSLTVVVLQSVQTSCCLTVFILVV